MPAEHPQEPQLGQVCMPWKIWGTCDLRHWSGDGKVEARPRTPHPVIDRGKAPGEYEPSGWTDGHVRLRGTHEFDQCVDRQHELVELGVDVSGFCGEPEGPKEAGAAGDHQHQGGFGRLPLEHEAITNVRAPREREWLWGPGLRSEHRPGK